MDNIYKILKIGIFALLLATAPTINSMQPRECKICLEKLSDPVKTLQCGHKFHESCIKDWFIKNLDERKIPLCPLCRAPDEKYEKEIQKMGTPEIKLAAFEAQLRRARAREQEFAASLATPTAAAQPRFAMMVLPTDFELPPGVRLVQAGDFGNVPMLTPQAIATTQQRTRKRQREFFKENLEVLNFHPSSARPALKKFIDRFEQIMAKEPGKWSVLYNAQQFLSKLETLEKLRREEIIILNKEFLEFLRDNQMDILMNSRDLYRIYVQAKKQGHID